MDDSLDLHHSDQRPNGRKSLNGSSHSRLMGLVGDTKEEDDFHDPALKFPSFGYGHDHSLLHDFGQATDSVVDASLVDESSIVEAAVVTMETPLSFHHSFMREPFQPTRPDFSTRTEHFPGLYPMAIPPPFNPIGAMTIQSQIQASALLPIPSSGTSTSEMETVEVDGVVYNNRGYEVCGRMNQHNKPCQRIGRCPFHATDGLGEPSSDKSTPEAPTINQASPISNQPEKDIPSEKRKETIEPTPTVTPTDRLPSPITPPIPSIPTPKEPTINTIPSIPAIAKNNAPMIPAWPLPIKDPPPPPSANASPTIDKKNVPVKTPYKQGWTKDEHMRFLNGLQIHGKGAWKEIALIVGSRTPTQIQSHAQKYYLRQKQSVKNKRSIHDITIDDANYESNTSISRQASAASLGWFEQAQTERMRISSFQDGSQIRGYYQNSPFPIPDQVFRGNPEPANFMVNQPNFGFMGGKIIPPTPVSMPHLYSQHPHLLNHVTSLGIPSLPPPPPHLPPPHLPFGSWFSPAQGYPYGGLDVRREPSFTNFSEHVQEENQEDLENQRKRTFSDSFLNQDTIRDLRRREDEDKLDDDESYLSLR
eukprot:TRINITY_DN15353_c0_g1_i1.p1 TRINITY_DN15353_c0_g1~~TRINITY_DN15353_c0_g1_i1.p1  ORF type:complete len:590 (+),score=120.52 TRINITY_DN15353_c0_g1_i1:76-1845(+)